MASLDVLMQRAERALKEADTGHGAIWLPVFCMKGEEEQACDRAIAEYCERKGVDPNNNGLRFSCIVHIEPSDEFYLPGDPNMPEGWKPTTDHQAHDPDYIKEVRATSDSALQTTIDLGKSGKGSTR